MKPCVLLDGGFDPLHGGHLSYFQSARLAFPDHQIVVSVCSDDDIRAKGREPLLSQAARVSLVGALRDVDRVIAKTMPTEYVIAAVKPYAYVKGKDWEGKLPEAQMAACRLSGTQIVFLNTVTHSSSGLLRRWALHDAERGLDRLETFMAEQTPASQPWQPVTDYSFDARKEIEGLHPLLIQEVFNPDMVLDAGCGPGHLVYLLRERGVRAYGCDLHPPEGNYFSRVDLCADVPEEAPKPFDLVINRECLEHLTVPQIRRAVTSLCRLSTKFVYGTTRFHPSPADVLDFTTEFDVDPTHISCGTQWFLRLLFALEGFRWRGDLAGRMDWMNKGRTFCFERIA